MIYLFVIKFESKKSEKRFKGSSLIHTDILSITYSIQNFLLSSNSLFLIVIFLRSIYCFGTISSRRTIVLINYSQNHIQVFIKVLIFRIKLIIILEIASSKEQSSTKFDRMIYLVMIKFESNQQKKRIRGSSLIHTGILSITYSTHNSLLLSKTLSF